TVMSEISGNFESGASVAVSCTPALPAALPTTTTLASSPNPSNDGQQVTFTATVAPSSGSGTPTGNVVFTIDGSAQAPVALDGTGKALLQSAALTPGNHTISARYAGSAEFLASSSPVLTQTVRAAPDPATTTTALTSSKNPSVPGESVTFTATVSSTAGTPTGNVVFAIDGVAQAPVALHGGTATLTNAALAEGSHQISARYVGNPEFLASTSPVLTQTVRATPSAAATTTIVTSSKNPSTSGESVTFTATVSSAADTAAGSLVFVVDGVSQAPVALDGAGRATWSSATLGAGNHRIAARYAGNSEHLASTSATITQVVREAAGNARTATALTSSSNPSPLGESITFTATVTSPAGTPTGAVTFFNGASEIGSASLSAGAATIQISTLTLGSHPIKAAYAGAAGFSASSSAVLQQNIAIPNDSAQLRNVQILMTQTVAQTSGQAISGAIDSAVSEGFEDGTAPISAGPDGVRLNLIAEPRDAQAGARGDTAPLTPQAFEKRTVSGDGGKAIDVLLGNATTTHGYAPVPSEGVAGKWRVWADIRNTQWRGADETGDIDGGQTNALAGVTYRFTSDLLAGLFGGYETFDYESAPLNGQLTGNGWTAGAYLGWRPMPGLRFDAGIAHSLLDYSGSAGAADGVFDGRRWLLQSGLTGSRTVSGFTIEPSARIYALWEDEDAYTDSLGVPQAERSFSTGRASGGVKVIYPFPIGGDFKLSPYAGLYGDYYFSNDEAGLMITPADAVADGWAARFVGGVGLESPGGVKASLAGEIGGLGSDGGMLGAVRARLSMPF
ncbi:Ig-like domain repeat protein, partial [Rhizobiaceae sp. 2RAB30]